MRGLSRLDSPRFLGAEESLSILDRVYDKVHIYYWGFVRAARFAAAREWPLSAARRKSSAAWALSTVVPVPLARAAARSLSASAWSRRAARRKYLCGNQISGGSPSSPHLVDFHTPAPSSKPVLTRTKRQSISRGTQAFLRNGAGE